MLRPSSVVTAWFIYTDLAGIKKRLALVISSEGYSNERGDLILAAISSRPVTGRYEYEIKEWHQAGLKLPSKVVTGKIITASSQIVTPIGELAAEDYREVQNLLVEVLGLGKRNARTAILDFLESRFDERPAGVDAALDTIQDLERLKKLRREVFKVNTIQEALKVMAQAADGAGGH